MFDLIPITAVALGGALGAVARFWLSGAIGRHFGELFPWGTLVVNLSGALAIGAAAAFMPPVPSASIAWTAAATGFLGGYTTASSFTLQTLNLARAGELVGAAANIAASVLLSITAAAAGFTLVTVLT